MDTIKNSNPHGPLDLKRLAAFEEKLCSRLPADYRQFLIAHNGGGLVPEAIILPRESEPFTLLADTTFGLHDGANSLEEVHANCQDAIPAEVIAFAEDHGGNLFCLGILGGHTGHVYLWDHNQSQPGDEIPGFAGMTLLAGSFTDFVAHLGMAQPGA